jgi:hypothetical protein
MAETHSNCHFRLLGKSHPFLYRLNWFQNWNPSHNPACFFGIILVNAFLLRDWFEANSSMFTDIKR